ncbi:MAG: hypothetical protein K9J83_07875 [Desulfarculaceae bacterium]|nr:hypothetical protein [Desulfarculaceae bacterium]
MTHEDKGHYAKKHPNESIDPNVKTLLEQKAENGTISCVNAHSVADKAGITPEQVGIQADLLELRVVKCRLGLFGHSPEGKHLDPDVELSPELEQKLENSSKNGRITCRDCWKIADGMKIKRNRVGSACDKKNIKIKQCQLGAF